MNEIIEIRKLLEMYYEGESTDADDQRLREYFTSDRVATELMPYRSIFAFLKQEKEEFEVSGSKFEVCSRRGLRRSDSKFKISRPVNWRYAAAAAVALLLAGTFLLREFRPASKNLCTGTYVMVNGVCYDDLALVRKYATEAIDLVTQPFGNGSAIEALDFLD